MTDTGFPGDVSEDALMDGRIRLFQPVKGYRVAVDPVLLAAFAPTVRGHVLDLGCGAGAILLCYALRNGEVRLTGLERDPGLAALARRNIAANDLADRADILEGDVGAPPASIQPGNFDLVLTNPPYLQAGRADPSPNAIRRAADVESDDLGLAAWLAKALTYCRHKGWLGLVQRADRLDDVLAALHGKAGAVTVLPVLPKEGQDATRILVLARKGVRTPARLLAPLVLHTQDGSYTRLAEQVLRHGAILNAP